MGDRGDRYVQRIAIFGVSRPIATKASQKFPVVALLGRDFFLKTRFYGQRIEKKRLIIEKNAL
jgi:hypothetical protein